MFMEGARLLDHAIEETITASPLKALSLAREALRSNRKLRCLRVRSACLVANNLAKLARPVSLGLKTLSKQTTPSP